VIHLLAQTATGDSSGDVLAGLLLVVFVGLIWAGAGAALSQGARRGVDPIGLFGLASVFILLGAWAFLPDYGALAAGPPPRIARLAAVVIIGGAVVAIGTVCVQLGMGRGHHGVVWTISQSALVIPFLAGVVIFGEPFVIHRGLGVVLVIASLSLLGAAKEQAAPDAARPRTRVSWLGFALLALVLLGVAQTCMTVPSHWDDWQDTANLRVPLLAIGRASPMLLLLAIRRPRLNRPAVLPVAYLTFNGICSHQILFIGMDKLRAADMVSIAFPMAVGTCIVAFAGYSLLIIRESVSRQRLIGIAAGVAGVTLVAV